MNCWCFDQHDAGINMISHRLLQVKWVAYKARVLMGYCTVSKNRCPRHVRVIWHKKCPVSNMWGHNTEMQYKMPLKNIPSVPEKHSLKEVVERDSQDDILAGKLFFYKRGVWHQVTYLDEIYKLLHCLQLGFKCKSFTKLSSWFLVISILFV